MSTVDGYESYYAEKLWALVPEVYRLEDGLADNPGVLRSIVEVIASQVAQSRRSVDRLWEDQSIDSCDDWAVAYIADLVATRPLPTPDARARRVDVARAIFFRRRRGTPALLRQLASELTGWDVVLVEAFRRLVRTPHRLDPPNPARGAMTGTPRAGTARLTHARVAELSSGAFDELYHLPDVRQLRGEHGRLNLGRVNFHLFRLLAWEIEGSTPYRLTDAGPLAYTFDPSGRTLPLFVRGADLEEEASFADVIEASRRGELERFDPPRCSSPREWEVEHPMSCRLLGHATFRIDPDRIANLDPEPLDAELAVLLRVAGLTFSSQARLVARLVQLGLALEPEPPWFRQLLRAAMTDDSGKKNLVPRSVRVSLDGVDVPFDAVAAANLECRDGRLPADPGARLLISPEHGLFSPLAPEGDEPPEVRVGAYHYGFAGPVGAGPYARSLLEQPAGFVPAPGEPPSPWTPNGVLTFDSSQTYDLALDTSTPVERIVVQSLEGKRPFVRLGGAGADAAQLVPAPGAPRQLAIDGLWLGSADARDQLVLERAPGAAAEFDWDYVVLRHVTLDPGGVRADASPLPSLRLLVRGRVRTLVVQRCILGAIEVSLGDGSSESGFVERLIVQDSIVDATRARADARGRRFALDAALGSVELEGVTLLGDVRAERLLGTDCIVMGQLFVADVEGSCLRFSAVNPGGNLPRRYRTFVAPIEPYYFTSLRFGDPGYCELSRRAPAAIARGAESRSEMGAFSSLLRPLRLDGAIAKIDEHRPVGILPQYIQEETPARGALPALVDAL